MGPHVAVAVVDDGRAGGHDRMRNVREPRSWSPSGQPSWVCRRAISRTAGRWRGRGAIREDGDAQVRPSSASHRGAESVPRVEKILAETAFRPSSPRCRPSRASTTSTPAGITASSACWRAPARDCPTPGHRGECAARRDAHVDESTRTAELCTRSFSARQRLAAVVAAYNAAKAASTAALVQRPGADVLGARDRRAPRAISRDYVPRILAVVNVVGTRVLTPKRWPAPAGGATSPRRPARARLSAPPAERGPKASRIVSRSASTSGAERGGGPVSTIPSILIGLPAT